MILSRNRSFKRQAPNKEAKLFIIVCEGEKREGDYFNYFSELDSRINVEVVRPRTGDDNSPTGLFRKISFLLEGDADHEPKYILDSKDEVWFVIDTDQWGIKIIELQGKVNSITNFSVAQSNPCFEIWLLYHFTFERPEHKNIETAVSMKQFLNNEFPGGFDSKKHPIFIADAINNSKHNYSIQDNQQPTLGSTQVHFLAENIYKIISKKIDSARNKV